MSREPPRDGEPLKDGIYRGKRVSIYRAGDSELQDQVDSAKSPLLEDMYDNAWCGYVETELDHSDDLEREFSVFGGITFSRNGWLGFDTMHSDMVGSKPGSMAEMRAEVEDLADQIIAVELEQGLIDEEDVEVAPE